MAVRHTYEGRYAFVVYEGRETRGVYAACEYWSRREAAHSQDHSQPWLEPVEVSKSCRMPTGEAL